MIPEIKTGDVVLFSNNTSTGFILRTATSSLWNHLGIAVRLHRTVGITLTDLPISLDEHGMLYILELNSIPRFDIIGQKLIAGMTLSDFEWLHPNYNQLSVRKLKEEIRNHPLFLKLIKEFIGKYHGYVFAEGMLPFLGVWMGLPFINTNKSETKEFFCSEMAAYFYDECVGPILAENEGVTYSGGDLKMVFGKEAPHLHCLYTPEHFSATVTPNSNIFVNEADKPTVIHPADSAVVLFQPLLLTLAVMVLLSMILPH